MSTGFSCKGPGSGPSSYIHSIAPPPRGIPSDPSGACGIHINKQAKHL
ncbi:rCG47342 [Rattus norvegicus]|uniref:RCG47342 n=1 Tax=Rattus norvegicus TaxID=10116 RepID=A6I050_RAT|nr:rCG47342 [Rattus norvegicus]